jgi:hypothetical protein
MEAEGRVLDNGKTVSVERACEDFLSGRKSTRFARAVALQVPTAPEPSQGIRDR